jgi:protein-disulfide isomerase
MSKSTRRLAAVLAAAAVVAGGAIAVSASSAPQPRSAPVTAAGALLGRIPERRGVLGSPRARVRVTEFLDPQCPVCAAASRQLLPQLIERYVRPGKVALDARVLHFIGPDSATAARYAAGARDQSRLWPFLETLYANQGTENSGYVTSSFLGAVAKASGVDDGSASAFAETGTADAALAAADREAKRLGIDSTPSFLVQRPGARPHVVDAAHLEAAL